VSDVLFPRLSQEKPDAEGVVATWFVADGDQVAAGQVIGEVMVDKVSGDVVAPDAGRVRLLAEQDDVVRQGEPVARVE
jgi:pyruvate/2-oxoglutarate dehydrogenase complex dihydrolipoamide acyltransferase (E2) component